MAYIAPMYHHCQAQLKHALSLECAATCLLCSFSSPGTAKKKLQERRSIYYLYAPRHQEKASKPILATWHHSDLGEARSPAPLQTMLGEYAWEQRPGYA